MTFPVSKLPQTTGDLLLTCSHSGQQVGVKISFIIQRTIRKILMYQTELGAQVMMFTDGQPGILDLHDDKVHQTSWTCSGKSERLGLCYHFSGVRSYTMTSCISFLVRVWASPLANNNMIYQLSCLKCVWGNSRQHYIGVSMEGWREV